MKHNLLLTMIALLLLVSCSNKEEKKLNYTVKEINGIKNFINKMEPANKDFNYKFNEVLTIKGENGSDNSLSSFYSTENLSIDSKNNIYIVDNNSQKIKKFDKDGKFITSFGNVGTGPGEYGQAKNLVILNDIVYISDPSTFKIIKFDIDGNFIDSKQCGNRTPEFILPSNKNNFMVGTDLTADVEEGRVFLKSSISKFDPEMNKINDLTFIKMEFNPAEPKLNPMDFMQIYSVSENNIYIADISEDNYKIKVYDYSGKDQYDISKHYRKIKMTEQELQKLNRQITVRNDDTISENKSEVHYRKAVHGLWEDKFGRLWVLSAREHTDDDKDLYFDIFENGVFINSIMLDMFKTETDLGINMTIRFLGDHLYIIDNNDEIKIRKFEYYI
ncbi:MAG: 6-bladed beta-propeller [Candidatus Delongbacteria bacterium]|nr:6-bladed beta-propeller [Candidatus Delongbacteria bacterium]